jgi:hypothetical protein
MTNTSKIIKESKLGKYTNIMSRDILVQKLLSTNTNLPSGSTLGGLVASPDANAKSLQAAADLIQSITIDNMTTKEIIEYMYKNFNKDEIDYVSSFIKILHAEDYNFNNQNADSEIKEIKTFKQTPFSMEKKRKKVKGGGYVIDPKNFYGLFRGTKKLNPKIKEIYSVEELILPKSGKSKRSTTVNEVVNNGTSKKLKQTKNSTSVSVILVDNPYIRIGTRNSIELSTFFNLASNIELSKCQPFIDVTFLVPNLLESPVESVQKFKTASITHFLQGTRKDADSETSIEKALNASFLKEVGEKEISGTTLNMSAFTMPQTLNNFDEIHIGHNENVIKRVSDSNAFNRSNAIHDITRPFMTIKNFVIDVAPTQGLMSFKTGKLSIVLHDRTRMKDIAPFIKTDMFGAFGSEIIVEYGWSHTDKLANNTGEENNENYLGQFLNNARTTEKYIITNSSFSIDTNGQVNIDLSIAARGPIDIRTATIKTDALSESYLEAATKAQRELVSNLSSASIKNKTKLDIGDISVNGLTNLIYNDIVESFRSPTSASSYVITQGVKNSFNKIINKKLKNAKSREKFESAFNSIVYILKRNGTETNKLHGDLSGVSFDLINIGDIEKLSAQDKKKLFSYIIKSVSTYFKAIHDGFLKDRDDAIGKAKEAIKSLIGGIDEADPFYNNYWNECFIRIIESGKANRVGKSSIPGIGTGGGTRFVSLGTFITSIISTHLAGLNKFDEIQIVSYTANEYCGLMSNLNVSSFLIPRAELNQFLIDLFVKGGDFTVESIISQVINEFIITRTCKSYGLAGTLNGSDWLYARNTNGSVTSRYEDAEDQELNVNLQLAKIYAGTANRSLTKSVLDEKATNVNKFLKLKEPDQKAKEEIAKNEVYQMLGDVRFLMPKIRMTFDALTSKKSSNDTRGRYETTILRISLFDQNDSPFNSINAIMRQTEHSENGLFTLVAKLNKLRHAKHQTVPDITSKEFYSKQWAIIEKFIYNEKTNPKGILHETPPDSGVYVIKSPLGFGQFKNYFKSIMPSITYGSQNSAALEASVTTVNEAKLNTVYLARTLSGDDKKSAKNVIAPDLPLRVMPSQASITLYGCPFVNFAQYLFLDYETGTTIDNAYAVTGIKHDLSPGKFTTTLTLSYGDVYGKYEGAINTLNKALKEATSDSTAVAQSVATAPPVNQPQTEQKVDTNEVVSKLDKPESKKQSSPQAVISPSPSSQTVIVEQQAPVIEQASTEEATENEVVEEEVETTPPPTPKKPAAAVVERLSIGKFRYTDQPNDQGGFKLYDSFSSNANISITSRLKRGSSFITDVYSSEDTSSDPSEYYSNRRFPPRLVDSFKKLKLRPEGPNADKYIQRKHFGYIINSLKIDYFKSSSTYGEDEYLKKLGFDGTKPEPGRAFSVKDKRKSYFWKNSGGSSIQELQMDRSISFPNSISLKLNINLTLKVYEYTDTNRNEQSYTIFVNPDDNNTLTHELQKVRIPKRSGNKLNTFINITDYYRFNLKIVYNKNYTANYTFPLNFKKTHDGIVEFIFKTNFINIKTKTLNDELKESGIKLGDKESRDRPLYSYEKLSTMSLYRENLIQHITITILKFMEIKYNKTGDPGSYIEVYNSFYFGKGEIKGKRAGKDIFKNFLSKKSRYKKEIYTPRDYDSLVENVRGIAEIIYAHLNIDFVIKRNIVKNKISYQDSSILYYDECGKNITPKTVAKPKDINKEQIESLSDLLSKSMYFSVYYYLLETGSIIKKLTGAKNAQEFNKKKKEVKFYSKYEKYSEEEIKNVLLFPNKINNNFIYITHKTYGYAEISGDCEYVEKLIDAVLKSINSNQDTLS